MTLIALHNDLRLLIEEDYPEIGVYLYVYKDNKCIRDELQNSIAICKDVAFELFGVPLSSWQETNP